MPSAGYYDNGGGGGGGGAIPPDDELGPPYLIPRTVFQDGTFPPEKKAASSMKLLFTMVALRVVLAQEEGFGNECHDDPSYTELYDDLTTFLQKEPLRDANEWLQKLMRHEKLNCRLAAVRIIEVRDVYASREFDWDETRREALDSMDECYQKLLNEHLSSSLSGGGGGGDGTGGGGQGYGSSGDSTSYW